jgi:hypothetical protein
MKTTPLPGERGEGKRGERVRGFGRNFQSRGHRIPRGVFLCALCGLKNLNTEDTERLCGLCV